MQYQRRLVQVFKAFIQKALIPQIRKADGSLAEWNKFCSLVSNETINFNDLQFYVDTLPNPNYLQAFDRKEINLLAPKPKDEIGRQNVIDSFNPNKTFGGQRSKMAMFPIKAEYDDFQKITNNEHKDFSSNTKQDMYKNKVTANSQSVIPALQRLYKSFLENQHKIESLGGNTQYTPEYKNYY